MIDPANYAIYDNVVHSDKFKKILEKLMHHTKLLGLLVLFALAGQAVPIRAAQISAVALTGYDGISFVSKAQINSSGQVAFQANYDLSGSAGNGIYVGSINNLQRIARTGDIAPDTGDRFTSLESLQLNNNGNVAFRGRYRVGVNTIDDSGIWSGTPNNISLVARKGSPAPGGSTFSDFSNLRLNDLNQIAFYANSGFWTNSTGNLSVLAKEGQAAPGFSATFSGFDQFSFSFNSAGNAVFTSGLVGPGINGTNDGALWFGKPNQLSLVAREGSQAPGMPPNINYSSFGAFSFLGLNNAGTVAFKAKVSGNGVDATNDQGMWTGTPGNLQLLVRTGDQAPGLQNGIVFADLVNTGPSVSPNGTISFDAFLGGLGIDGTNKRSLWVGTPGNLVMVARGGDHAPGTPIGTNFIDFPTYGPVINSTGQYAFYGELNQGGNGIWATDLSGTLRLVARTGDQFEVAPGDVRTFSNFGAPDPGGNEDGELGMLNDAGQLVFLGRFTDGTSGVFIADINVIPEPSLFLIAMVFASVFAAIGWRNSFVKTEIL